MKEIKEHLKFNINFHSSFTNEFTDSKVTLLIIDADILEVSAIEAQIKKLDNKIKLLISNSNQTKKINQDKEIKKPFSITDFNKKIIEILTIKKFSQNSTIKIKNFILDKNEKKLIRDNNFIIITEKEIQLLEILFNNKKPLSKKDVLNKIWKYASSADTHTVETHIYRLRKKILSKFNEELILSNKEGYLI